MESVWKVKRNFPRSGPIYIFVTMFSWDVMKPKNFHNLRLWCASNSYVMIEFLLRCDITILVNITYFIENYKLKLNVAMSTKFRDWFENDISKFIEISFNYDYIENGLLFSTPLVPFDMNNCVAVIFVFII